LIHHQTLFGHNFEKKGSRNACRFETQYPRLPLDSLISEGVFDIARKSDELEALQNEASKPDLWNNSQHAQQVTQRLANLREEIGQYGKLHSQLEDNQVLLELAIEEDDESVSEEIGRNLEDIGQQIEQMATVLMLDGEHDRSNAILTIHPGAGGTESQDWAYMLLRMYTRWCDRHGYRTESIELMPGEEAGIKSATVLVSGEYAYGYLSAEVGVHRLVRLSPFDFNHRRHTSFAAVAVSPEIGETVDVDIQPAELRIDTYRSSGAGGQHVNRTDSAVRMTHIPTGIVAQCQNERSQHKNRELAMKVLRSRVYEYYQMQRREKITKLQGERPEINFGNQIRSYVFHPYRLVKDLRTSVETGNIDAVMDGNLEIFIESYLKKRSQT
jgi:peptide chain release factor 2